jgi:hypothetical protein
MSISNRFALRDGLRQSRTSRLGHCAAVYGVVRRDRILFRVGMSLTRLQDGPPGPGAAPPIGDRFDDSSVIAGHGGQDRPDVLIRAAFGAAALPTKGLPGLLKPGYHAIGPASGTQC